MKTYPLHIAFLIAVGLFLAGCATTSQFRPEGMTEQQISQTLQEQRHVASHLIMGTPVKLSFYKGAVDTDGTALNEDIQGFFYAYNKMNDTISVSKEPLKLVDRGNAYYLNYISAISTMMPSVSESTRPEDAPRLSRIGFQQAPDFQRELLTQ